MLTGASEPTWGRRLAGMDGLRAVACFFVMAAHTWQAGPAGEEEFGGAYANVEALAQVGLILFFTLSGFLLYRPFATAILDGVPRPRTRAYLTNRALRILPAYWAILALTLVAAAWAQSGDPFDPGRFDGALTGLLNPLLVQTYVPETNMTGISPAWSLSVEIVFYVLLPVLAVAAARLARRRRTPRGRAMAVAVPALALLVLGACGKVATVSGARPDTWDGVLEASFLTKADLFCWGMVAAVIVSALPRERLARLPGRTLGIAGVIFITLGDLGNATPTIAFGCGLVLLAVAVAFAGGPRRHSPARALESRPFVLFGLASYSAYLWHWPVVIWLADRGLLTSGWTGVVLNLLVVATLTIALSTVTYRYVEAPAIRRKSLMVDHRTSRRVIAAQVATGEAAP